MGVAQTYVHSGQVHIQAGSQVVVTGGEVVNKATFVNQGNLVLTSNWQNLASYPSALGSIALLGSAPQKFSHNGDAIGVLYIENPTSVEVSGDVTVAGKLILAEGLVIPVNSAEVVISEEAVVEGGGSNAYVEGMLYHSGTGTKFYPIGKNGWYAPLTLEQVTGQNPVVGVEFSESTAQPLTGPDMQLPDFYWQVHSLSGTFTGSPVSLLAPLNSPPREGALYILAGSEQVDVPFTNMAEAEWQMVGNEVQFTTSSMVNSAYLTIGRPTEGAAPGFYLPNALSPSAPHPEDRTIKIYSETIQPEGFSFTIWDSWGHVVYTTNSYTEASTRGWQGNYTGKGEAQPGMYKYLLQGTYTNGKPFNQKGTLFLYK
jgi:hypothetical protein